MRARTWTWALVLAAFCPAGGAGGEDRPAHHPPAATDVRELLPERFWVYETPRYVLYSDASTAWTATQARHLERTHEQFMRFCRRLDLQPQPLRHKLVAILFDHRNDYQAFASRHDDVNEGSLAGYYAPGPDRMVFYNVQSSPSLAQAREKLEDMDRDIRSLEALLRQAERSGQRHDVGELRRLRGDWQQHLSRERQRVDAFAEQTATATLIHEAIHQLLFHTGIQAGRVEYPLWISEGLATAFETDAPGAAFGPDREYAPRRRQFEEILSEGRLLTLERLLTLTSKERPHHDDVDVLYPQSAALVAWMCRFRSGPLRAYLESLRLEPAGRPTAQRHMELFVSAFGDLALLERAWLAHERGRAHVSARRAPAP